MMNQLTSHLRTARRLICNQRSFSSTDRGVSNLKIAFFGSDEFSIESLRHLLQLSQSQPQLISQIDIIAKHPKYVNRGLKELKDLPIVQFAQSAKLNIIRAETKNEIIDQLTPRNYDLLIAVSYGKLIPSKILQTVPYSLNVHPSLLPRYSGASPLQYALLNHDRFTGVTVQTLHPTEFDKGEIVDQTPELPIDDNETLISLRDRLSIKGGELLASVIAKGLFMNPHFASSYEYSYAPKIKPCMNEINWQGETAFQIERKFNTLGPLFSFKEMKIKKKRKPIVHEYRRVIFANEVKSITLDGFPMNKESNQLELQNPGDFKLVDDQMIVKTIDGFISVKDLQLEFEPRENATKFMAKLPKRGGLDTSMTFSEKLQIESTSETV